MLLTLPGNKTFPEPKILITGTGNKITEAVILLPTGNFITGAGNIITGVGNFITSGCNYFTVRFQYFSQSYCICMPVPVIKLPATGIKLHSLYTNLQWTLFCCYNATQNPAILLPVVCNNMACVFVITATICLWKLLYSALQCF